MDGRQVRQETVETTKSRLSTDSLLPQRFNLCAQRACFQKLGAARFAGESEISPSDYACDDPQKFER